MRQLSLFLCLGLLAVGAGALIATGQERPPSPPPPAGLQPPGGFPQPGFDPGRPGRPPAVRLADQFKELVPALIQALKDADGDVRQSAAGALAGLGRDAVKPLLEAAADKDKELQANALYVLGYFPGEAKEVMPVLLNALKDDDKDVRRRAAFSIQRLVHNTGDMVGWGVGEFPGGPGPGGVPFGGDVMIGPVRPAAKMRTPDPGLVLPGGDKLKK